MLRCDCCVARLRLNLPTDVAGNFSIRVRIVHKWARRNRDERTASLKKQSSAAKTQRHKLFMAWAVIKFMRDGPVDRLVARSDQFHTVTVVRIRHRIGHIAFRSAND